MLKFEDQARYAAFKVKDPRFDGRFFVGVSSTGIYCRPICKAKLPKPKNCAFYTSAAAAEQAGFRPCLLCRPELAPGNAPVDAASSLARRAAWLLEQGFDGNLEKLAGRLGCSGRHLRRAFTAEYGVSPVRYVQTCKLLLAKSLLSDTHLPVSEVAMAAGFGSLRRFNDLFKKQYRLAPSALRRASAKEKAIGVTLALGYRPPYQWRKILDFLAGRAIPGVEMVAGGAYWRTVHFVTRQQRRLRGWIRIGHQPRQNALAVTVDSALLPILPSILARVRHLFDLYCDPLTVYETLAPINRIRPGFCLPGTRLPGCFDIFEMLVRAVLEQQTNRQAAGALAAGFARSYGAALQTGINGLTHTFPAAQDILALKGSVVGHFSSLGISQASANIIGELAKALACGHIDFNNCAQAKTEMEKLATIAGMEAWTAQYIAMRVLAWHDAFPHADQGAKKALAPLSAREILALAETWRPWRGYATANLWS